MHGDLAVQTSGLTRDFGSFRAVDGIDLAVPAGSFYGFLGPNGAGKSTTIKCLTGLLRPTAGSMRILGIDPLADPVCGQAPHRRRARGSRAVRPADGRRRR